MGNEKDKVVPFKKVPQRPSNIQCYHCGERNWYAYDDSRLICSECGEISPTHKVVETENPND